MIVHRAVALDAQRLPAELHETLQAARQEGRLLRWALTRLEPPLLEIVLLL